MNSNREELLFSAALEKPAAERALFLEGACFGDQALRQRIETLLAAHQVFVTTNIIIYCMAFSQSGTENATPNTRVLDSV